MLETPNCMNAANPKSMAERLGDVLHREACIAAVPWAIFVLVVTPALARHV
jgi:hypothetical protein